MYIIWKNPNMKLHGKQHKGDCFYYRWHYGQQRRVCIYKKYVDKPTEKQKASREAFTELRREVARQLHDPILRARWEVRFKKDKEGYKMLHTYVYAKMKAGQTVIETSIQSHRSIVQTIERLSNNNPIQMPQLPQTKDRPMYIPPIWKPLIIIHNNSIIPLFLPIPITNECKESKDKYSKNLSP